MTAQTIFISDFSGGIRRDVDAALIPDNACRDAANVTFDRHTLRVRPGRKQHSKLPNGASTKARYLFEFANSADSPSARLLSVHDTAIYATDSSDQKFRQEDGTTPAHALLNTTVSGSNPVRMAQFNNELGNRMYIVDGSANVKWWEPGLSVVITGITENGGTATCTTTSAHQFRNGDTVIISGNSVSGYNTSHTITRVNSTSFTFSTEASGTGTGGTATSDTTVVELFGQTPPSVPVSINNNSNYQNIGIYQSGQATGASHYVTDGGATPVYPQKDQWNPWRVNGSDAEGATVRLMTRDENQHPTNGHTSCIALELVRLDTGNKFNAEGFYICPVSSDGSVAYDLSQASNIRFDMKIVVDGANKPVMTFKLYEEFDFNNPPSDMTDGIAVDLTGVSLNTWERVDIPLTGIDAADRDAVKFIAFKVDAGYTSDNIETDDLLPRLEFDSADKWPALSYALTVLLDKATVDITAGTLQPATDYFFTYTYAYDVDGEIIESMRVADKTYRTVDDAFLVPQSLELVTTIDAAAAPEYVYLYAYGGQLGDTWIRLEAHTVGAGETTWTKYWTGAPPDDVQTFTYGADYANAPLAGATCIMSWNSRMLYANAEPGVGGAKDCLHVSNVNHPDQVPQEPLYDMSTTNGFWTRIGEDGQPITALAEVNGQPLVFKQRGIWRVLGHDANTVAVQRLSQTHGAWRQEAVCAVGGGVVWRDHTGVWLYDGNDFRQLGPIELLQAYGFSNPEKEFAVYDPIHQLYVLTNPKELVAVLGIERASDIATATTDGAHGLSVGDHCLVEGGATSAFRALATVTGVDGNTFTYDNAGTNGAASGTYHVTGSTALVYSFKSRSWTRWDGMPGGCAIFAYQAREQGWYAVDTYNTGGNGCLFRMMAGDTDDGATFTGAAIPFTWYSKVFTAPDPRVYKQVGEVRAVLSVDEPLSALTLALRTNGAASDTAAKAAVVETAPARMGEARWLPARHADVTRWQVGVSGSSAGGGEIPLIKVKVTAQSEY